MYYKLQKSVAKTNIIASNGHIMDNNPTGTTSTERLVIQHSPEWFQWKAPGLGFT